MPVSAFFWASRWMNFNLTVQAHRQAGGAGGEAGGDNNTNAE